MQYKTVMLELIQDRVEWHERLMEQRVLLETMEKLAVRLREVHLIWISELTGTQAEIDSELIKHEAFRLAVEEMQPVLDAEAEQQQPELSLDNAMAFLKQHTKRE